MTLDELRRQIDAVDDEIVRLLDERARLVKEVGRVKAELGQPFYVPDRERAILERIQRGHAGAFPTDALKPVFSEIISACLSLEQLLKVAFLGPEATFTHMAARARFGLSARYVPAATISGVFAEVEKKLAHLGVVPIENSTEGVVNSTLDVFVDSPLTVLGEIVLEVSHCLLTRSGTLDGIEKVYSHPQALAQCRRWLSESLPKAVLIEVASTALAARLAKDDPSAAAVASELAAKLYELRVAKTKIEDEVRNVTRFLVIGREQPKPSGHDTTSVMFSFPRADQPGALHQVLQILAQKGVNLSRIESRPSRRRTWEYLFFADLDGHVSEPRIADALAALESKCELVKVLGSYPKAESLEEGE